MHIKKTINRGYTLIELVVSIGLFAVVMTLSTGAYLMMISANQHAQSIASGINNLSFALETMMRDIRTGTGYSCGPGGDCASLGATYFSFTNSSSIPVQYAQTTSGAICGAIGKCITKSINGGTAVPLTDTSITIDSLMFYVTGTPPLSAGSDKQPYVTIVVSGSVIPKAGKDPIPFNMETSAVMRGTDL